MKQTAGTRGSGQSRLMDDTFAGQNACNPENHKRPFIVEWDATDASSFESLTASDIVFVKYEGCNLVVLDECKNDSLAGDMGAYKPVEWTTGGLETIDIQNSAELYAKLPLGEATLGARVAGGEAFHMEYYVAGTRYASRDAVYQGDIEGRYGCETATHFVYAYNLGAFALGSKNEFVAEAGASAFGFGGGAGSNSSSSADKRGGDLAVCSAESATEIAGCKAPIRLSLRNIRPGESPEAQGMAAPVSDASMTAVASMDAKLQANDQASGYIKSAQEKMNAGDGKGCLAELTKHDKADPKDKSEDPNSVYSQFRAQCLMLSGQCAAGRQLMGKWFEKHTTNGPEQIDKGVDSIVSTKCRGKMTTRDKLLTSSYNLMQGANMTKESPEFCQSNFDTAMKAMAKAKPRGDDDRAVTGAPRNLYATAPHCFVKAGDCKGARKAFDKLIPLATPQVGKESYEQIFNNMHPKCAPK